MIPRDDKQPVTRMFFGNSDLFRTLHGKRREKHVAIAQNCQENRWLLFEQHPFFWDRSQRTTIN